MKNSNNSSYWEYLYENEVNCRLILFHMKPLIVKTLPLTIICLGFVLITGSNAFAQKNKSDQDDKLKKIMIMFLGSKYENRKTVESEITYYINDSGFEALQSYKYFTVTHIPEPDTIIMALEDNGFDGLLVIEIVDVALKEERVNAKMTYGPAPGPGTPYLYGFYNYFSIYFRYSEGYERIDTSFELETSLFRLEDKSLIYSNTSKAYDKGDIDIALEGFAIDTAKKLKKSKTLLKTK